MLDNQKGAQRGGARGRHFHSFVRLLGWLAAVGLAVFPFPWWW